MGQSIKGGTETEQICVKFFMLVKGKLHQWSPWPLFYPLKLLPSSPQEFCNAPQECLPNKNLVFISTFHFILLQSTFKIKFVKIRASESTFVSTFLLLAHLTCDLNCAYLMKKKAFHHNNNMDNYNNNIRGYMFHCLSYFISWWSFPHPVSWVILSPFIVRITEAQRGALIIKALRWWEK